MILPEGVELWEGFSTASLEEVLRALENHRIARSTNQELCAAMETDIQMLLDIREVLARPTATQIRQAIGDIATQPLTRGGECRKATACKLPDGHSGVCRA